jgi:glycosyltransferase involved in cell wall biosynthesis
VLVEAISIVREKIPEAKALFIGNSNQREGLPYPEWIRKTYGDTVGCQFIGYIPRNEVLHYMSESRVFALPARFDNFSMAVIEAMASGRPVVISAKCGVSEFIERRGGGLIIPPDDPNALAEALIPFLEDAKYAAAIGKAARLAVQTWLSPDVIAIQREKVYQRAIESFRKNFSLFKLKEERS